MGGKLLRLLEMPDNAPVSGIQFHFQRPGTLKHRHKLKAFILLIFKKENTRLLSINYVFCSDKFLLDINKSFLQHDYYTDIITFNLATKKAPVEAEIYISLDRVRENAQVLQQKYIRELHRVIFHGALHLCGYKDKTAAEIVMMRKKEDFYLEQYFK
jgi:probable rRNA maturation factor